jgi:hypothetical protein
LPADHPTHCATELTTIAAADLSALYSAFIAALKTTHIPAVAAADVGTDNSTKHTAECAAIFTA